ncbi:PREDICTED: zinc finger FYVE domain-containing protein 1-like isoform X2 [Drosophila arizonae]|uniref:Zinc finger FYVE domain-containing protein 1-like isoform X2 n=1 Tax=Drosophila arizonae TaxID=7263 RepID=A0ABM1PVW0_DROAR|nr:PREDICTED: zinc finger FYVE domain-containing protein 1-like isoform X2 [Drosophila arizonae]XP_017871347.1 PREDICTED: zinc finger FYVE domain-containing protein 1-like isoform X2 [Drosophila arizonae]
MAFLVSITEDEALRLDVINDAEFKSIPFINTNEHDSIDNENGSTPRAFLFLDADENLQIATPELFCKKLKCQSLDKIKVISIFGNTGDGKSHTMNQVFFDGEPVFRTSPEQSSCTIGVYAAMQREQGVLCLDTEGLLGTTAKSNKRMRMLLKILAISDIVVYRTRSERLHSDMYEFLGTASKAFCLHFTQALQAMGNGSTLGPAVIIFHETHYTKPLESTVEESAEDKLRNNFALLNYETNAFSSLRYVGIQTDANKSTNFKKISDALHLEIENTAVRSPRQPAVVFKAMKLLNQKFAGEIIEKAINPFPEQYFTCGAHCESCSRRCQRSMGHVSDGEPHFNTQPCNYQHQFGNKLYLCKACYNNGKEIVVSVRAQAQTDTAWSGLAKYVWKGDVIECPYCGEIYRARQYWYGNKSPEASVVHVQVVHVWKGGNAVLRANAHSAQMVLDSVNSISEAFTNISAPWAKALSGMLADKVAPSYWRPNQEIIMCHACRRSFEKSGMPKHHCRGCGEGFCHTCSQHRVPVPGRGWLQPVRVCNDCYQQLQRKSDATPGSRPTNDEGDILVRKYGETIYNTISSVAAVAIDYPKAMIKDSARPAYWVPDAESPNCFICKSVFGRAEELELAKNSSERGKPKGSSKTDARGSSSNGGSGPRVGAAGAGADGPGDCRRHHCRRCGQAVCSNCSKRRMPVLERGWQTDVRVCDACACVPSGSQHSGNNISSAISDALNEDEAMPPNGLCENRRESNRSSIRSTSSSSDCRNCNASDDVKAKSE